MVEIDICQHKFCKECLIEFLTNLSFNVLIKCPYKNCHFNIDKKLLVLLLTDEQYRKVDKLQNRQYIKKINNAGFCPFPDCESYYFKETSNSLNYYCLVGHEVCSKCLDFHKTKDQCDKIDKIALNNWVNKNKIYVKNCPKCNELIQKDYGCNHMSCSNPLCKYEFCWLCLGKFDNNHYSSPTSLCFGLSNTEESSIIAKSGFIRFCMFFLKILGIIILCAIALSFITSIFFIIGIIQFGKNIGLKKDFGFCFHLLNILTGFFLGIALSIPFISFVLVLLVMSIFILIFVALPYSHFKKNMDNTAFIKPRQRRPSRTSYLEISSGVETEINHINKSLGNIL